MDRPGDRCRRMLDCGRAMATKCSVNQGPGLYQDETCRDAEYVGFSIINLAFQVFGFFTWEDL